MNGQDNENAPETKQNSGVNTSNVKSRGHLESMKESSTVTNDHACSYEVLTPIGG
jgi:hypothetical protein